MVKGQDTEPGKASSEEGRPPPSRRGLSKNMSELISKREYMEFAVTSIVLAMKSFTWCKLNANMQNAYKGSRKRFCLFPERIQVSGSCYDRDHFVHDRIYWVYKCYPNISSRICKGSLTFHIAHSSTIIHPKETFSDKQGVRTL